MPRRLLLVLCVVKMLLLVSIPMLLMFGCSRRKTNSDTVMHSLQEIINRSRDRIEVEQRARLAILKWQNGVADGEPFLIDVAMTKSRVRDGERIFLMLVIYDEDVDIVGFAIEEERVDSNGVRTTLLEEYPVFTHLLDRGVVEFKFIPVLVRDENQRKPEDQWQKYMSTPRQQLREEYMRRLKKKYWSWRDTLPPVWVSVSEPNKVDVRLRAYDRAGHLSEWVSLVHEHIEVPQPLKE